VVGAWGWPTERGHGSSTRRTVQSLLILLFCAGVAGSGVAASLRTAPPVPAGIDLLADASSPNLTNTSAEAPPRLDSPAPAAPAEPEPAPLPVSPTPPVPAPDDTARPKPQSLPPEVLLGSTAPVADAPNTSEPLHPGGSIMVRHSERLLPVVLAAFLAASPAISPVDAQEKNKDEVILDKLKKIQESVDAVTTQVSDLSKNTDLKIQKALEKTNGDIAELKGQVTKLTQDMETLRKSLTTPQVSGYGPSGKEMDDLRKQLDRLELSLKTLREQMGTTRTAAFPPTQGRVVLQNDYPYDMQFIVNSTAYTLRPREQYEVKLPAGTFTFRIPAVPGYETAQTRTLGTEKPHVISVYPR
jgi:hypothetical protein